MERRNLFAPGFIPPRGYQDAVHTTGAREYLALGGHVAFDADRRILHPGDLIRQFRVTLENVKSTLTSAGFAFDDVVKLTIHVVNVAEYRANLKELGAIWREVFGRVFPAMTLIGVTGLLAPGCVVEIDGVALR